MCDPNPVFEKFADISLDCDGGEETHHVIQTEYGKFHLTLKGDPRRTAFVTLHDIGLNSATNFGAFFETPEMQILTSSFRTVHIDIPGQEQGSPVIPCPSMGDLVVAIEAILTELEVGLFIGFGHGAGAFLMNMLALRNPSNCTALVLFNANGDCSSWTDSTSLNINAHSLRQWGMTNGVRNFLRWYHCGRVDESTDQDLIQSYDERFEKVNAINLASWMLVYASRPPLGLTRSSGNSFGEKTIRCPILLVVGKWSPHLEHTRKLYSGCNIETTTLYEIDSCSTPLDEHPAKVFGALVLHLQGAGYSLSRFRRLFKQMRQDIADVESMGIA